jgi:hypothetical protein
MRKYTVGLDVNVITELLLQIGTEGQRAKAQRKKLSGKQAKQRCALNYDMGLQDRVKNPCHSSNYDTGSSPSAACCL